MSFRKKRSLSWVTNVENHNPNDEALKKSEANLRTIFDNTDSAYILFGTDLQILSFNLLAQQYSEENNKKSLAIGKYINEYFSAERWPQIMEMLKKLSKGETISYELSIAGNNGVTKWHQVRWLNVKNSGNKNWGFILENKDITEIKTATLERDRITNDLTQHNRDLEQFTYIISHNLRAPVANILGLTNILKDHGQGMDAETQQEVIDRIFTSTKNIDTTIKDLNQILQTRKPVGSKKEKIEFESMVDAVKTSLRNTIALEKVKIDCDFTSVASIFTTRSYLYSIFYNLTSNSIKYRKADVAPLISITSKKVDDKIELHFKDNGKGIDLDKNAEDVFGLYKRFDTSVEGKGMGLFMVKTQVSALGGSINVESKLGEGTEFILQFNQSA
ncbi:ATP-binding protein [Mucilaginibacter sp. E4BP6]|uniref:PAS domain-containing sensor histidine kinase n=1 Tax=Mucilaginibacter sp. E4BP6 TaxID=2723089 RepID=UPI0015C83A30|nr:PAS domain-containing sensor histidine kinase [Mucilaginibacter sp. E4BP6]NYE68442.1 PAS domain S-box-containing protein [Mucilaginibacter sp. E4BP6]